MPPKTPTVKIISYIMLILKVSSIAMNLFLVEIFCIWSPRKTRPIKHHIYNEEISRNQAMRWHCHVFVVSESWPSLIYVFNSLLPLGSTALVESWVDKVEGRKVFAFAELKSPDGKLTYVTANALFIQLDPQSKK